MALGHVRFMKDCKFHFSIDDVLASLIQATDKNIALKDSPFFRDLWLLFNRYGLKTGLYVFNSTWLEGKKRSLSEVRNLQQELEEGWLFFGAHALDFDTAPYDQTLEENINVFGSIYSELDRIAGSHICRSVRLHYHSECYELADFFKKWGVTELLTTDKPVGLHRFAPHLRAEMLKKGNILYNGMNLRRSHMRIENLANDTINHADFIDKATKTLNGHGNLVLYSHEYEHERKEVVAYLYKAIQWVHEDLNLISEHP